MPSDSLTKEERSKQMSLVRSKNTKPEMLVRRSVHGMGYRYRLHKNTLPGIPDLVFASRKKVIFVHGCFWHQHSDSECPLARMPKSRLEFWETKLKGNHLRDKKNLLLLNQLGWDTLIIWECELRDMSSVTKKMQGFLDEIN